MYTYKYSYTYKFTKVFQHKSPPCNYIKVTANYKSLKFPQKIPNYWFKLFSNTYMLYKLL